MNNKSSKEIHQDLQYRRIELEESIQNFQKLILEQDHKIEELESTKDRDLDNLYKDLLTVIDAFNKADIRLNEQFPENAEVAKSRKRFATAKNKLVEILNKNGVTEIEFPDGMATLEDCEIDETEPDASKADDTIISIVSPGYRRNGRLIRLAKVVVVKN
ncbi:MAG: nucleotide exchange factor GrpE [Muribaculaceae bacterium]|nr:nucleotide exchange factor GrpE [Muribaculaceae bacterium]